MKRLEYKIVGLVILFLLCWMGYTPIASRGAVVWSDDFDDGDYDGWSICSNTVINPPSDWSAANYHLQVLQGDSGTISHPSNVAYGTWSFDFKANGTQVTMGQGLSIGFISNDINNVTDVADPEDWSCYGLKIRAAIVTEGQKFYLSLTKWYRGVFTILDDTDSYLPVVGCHHIDVSRTIEGLFHVYVNGSLVMQGEDNEMTTSKLFVVSLADWNMIDNVVVDDAPPTDWLPIAIVGVSAVAIIVVVVIFLRRS
jgi:hypothetical protein